jgi:hypothetical protein
MAYALANPIKKISQAGDSNSIWFYTDGDAKATVVIFPQISLNILV